LKYLLDTHIWLWLLSDPHQIMETAAHVINAPDSGPLGISDISAWEIVRKESLGKLKLPFSSRSWLHQATRISGLYMLRIDPETAWESCHLPGRFHRDPADQIIVATARIHGLKLITRDRRLLTYPHVEAIEA